MAAVPWLIKILKEGQRAELDKLHETAKAPDESRPKPSNRYLYTESHVLIKDIDDIYKNLGLTKHAPTWNPLFSSSIRSMTGDAPAPDKVKDMA